MLGLIIIFVGLMTVYLYQKHCCCCLRLVWCVTTLSTPFELYRGGLLLVGETGVTDKLVFF